MESICSREIHLEKDGWIKLNADGVGFYRVKYDEKIFSNLVRDVSKMDVRNRFTIQSDIQAMTKYGLKNAVEYLRLLDAYKDGNSFFYSLAPP